MALWTVSLITSSLLFYKEYLETYKMEETYIFPYYLLPIYGGIFHFVSSVLVLI